MCRIRMLLQWMEQQHTRHSWHGSQLDFCVSLEQRHRTEHAFQHLSYQVCYKTHTATRCGKYPYPWDTWLCESSATPESQTRRVQEQGAAVGPLSGVVQLHGRCSDILSRGNDLYWLPEWLHGCRHWLHEHQAGQSSPSPYRQSFLRGSHRGVEVECPQSRGCKQLAGQQSHHARAVRHVHLSASSRLRLVHCQPVA